MMTLEQYVSRYALQRGIRSNSEEQYKIAARCFEQWAKRPFPLAEFSEDAFNSWLVHIETRLSNETVRTRKRHVAALWRSAYADRMCPTPYVNERIRRVPCRRPPTQAWSIDEVRALIEVARGLQGIQDVGLTRATFWELMVRTAWSTALRLGDLLSAQTREFTDDGCALISQHKTSRPVFVRLTPLTRELHQQTGWRLRKSLVPWPYSREYFRKEFERLVEMAGMIGSLKKLRKSSATNIEMCHPGWSAVHLGHQTGFRTADAHYLDFRLIGSKKPDPEEL